jgi:hypothetical protein
MPTDYWRTQINHVILSPGDMIIDSITGHYAVLIERVKKDVGYEIESNIYFWRVKWSYDADNYREVPHPDWMEEDGLKMSIVVGFYDLHAQSKGKI